MQYQVQQFPPQNQYDVPPPYSPEYDGNKNYLPTSPIPGHPQYSHLILPSYQSGDNIHYVTYRPEKYHHHKCCNII